MLPKQRSSKAVVLGLDGVSWSLAGRLARQGVMPNLAALLREAQAGPMQSTRPEISPVAWTSFFTAAGPGEHGIYGFTEFEPGGYHIRFNSSAQVRRPRLWDWLGLRGRRSVVLNVPLTYPARSLQGIMVSGFPALDWERAAHPPELADYLRRLDYRLEADFERVHQDRPAFLADLGAALSGRERLVEEFWTQEWDLFVLVVTDTDRLLHFFYREFLEGGPVTDHFLDFFRRVDRLAGRVHELSARLARGALGPVFLFLVSDHGFAPVEKEFHLNRWLGARGFRPEPGPEARAMALDPNRIYLNRAPRFPGGRLNSTEAEATAIEITTALVAEPAVAGVVPGRELYSG
ncbi:MAG: alkaline phosphatase family protein, partial [Thermodesulfobacteriota bacterium]